MNGSYGRVGLVATVARPWMHSSNHGLATVATPVPRFLPPENRPRRCMKGLRIAVALWLLAVSAGAQPADDVLDARSLRLKQEDQQRARGMARQLVDSVLAFQLQQLEDNGLQDMQIYRDIRTMCINIDGLVEAEMGEVITLLLEARSADRAERREQLFIESRQLIRSIVIRLSIERQNLLRRLKTAEIAEQVRRLIQLETSILDVTKSLPTEATARREQLAVETMEDQRDVKGLFLHLVETLSDAANWGGAVAAGAADGLRVLKAAQVGKHLDQADIDLEAARFAPAAVEQAQAVLGLQQLLRVIIRTQGLIGTDRQAALDKVRELAERQEKAREEVRQSDSSEPPQTELVEEQAEIRRELGKLDALLESATEQTHREQAEQAAMEATADLFDAEHQDALREQGKVLGHLAALEELLKQIPTMEDPDKSADEYADLIRDLEAARDELQAIQKEQQDASKTAESNRPEAKTKEEEIAKELSEVPQDRELPDAVQSRVASAEDAVREAAEVLKESSDAQEDRIEEATESAEESIERALAETEAALADAKRREAAVKIGELARAAEALERAAAAERRIASDASEASQSDGLSTEEAKRLSEEQTDVDEVARKVAEGVGETSPQTAEKLAEALDDTKAVADKLKQAEQTPGEASKPASNDAGSHAERAARKLAESAAQLRKDMGKTAEQLVAESDQQLQRLSETQNPLDRKLAEQQRSLAQRLARLAEAAEKVDEAMQMQHKASGRPQAAEAMRLAHDITDAKARQQEADRAAAEVAKGRANTPLEATARQQQVADASGNLAEQAAKQRQATEADDPEPLEEALRDAQQAAAHAAQKTLAGRPEEAEAARQEVRKQLETAHKMAQAKADEAAGAEPVGGPDADAQQRVGNAADEAQDLAGHDAPQAGETLEKTNEASKLAEKQIEAGDKKATENAQEQVRGGLRQADEQIAEAMQNLAKELSEERASDAQTAGELAKDASRADPGATGALRAAQDTAEMAADRETPSPADAKAAEASVRADFERAAADLAAREQQVRSDKAIAEAMKRLAEEQQAAADEIAERRADLNEAEPLDTEPPSEMPNGDASEPAESAEDALARATRKFAEAQRATGQGAVQVSGQEEVANPPLREALQLASDLMPDLQLPDAAELQLPSGIELADGELTDGEVAALQNGETADAVPSQPTAAPLPAGNVQEGQQPEQGQPTKTNLGTGFVPSSPEMTAALMAGYVELPELLANLMAQAAQASQNQPAAAQQPADAMAAATQQEAAAAESQSAANTPPQDAATADRTGDSQTPGAQRENASIRTRQLRDESWFAKLPPELRKAIRANARQRAPRAYEERLRRYFESIE